MVDRHSGTSAWELQIGSPAIGSPVVVDDALDSGGLLPGRLYAWDVSVRTG